MDPENLRIPINDGTTSRIHREHPSSESNTQPASPSFDDAVPTDFDRLQKAFVAKQDECLRLRADFDNFIKRTQRNSEQLAAAEKESFIRDLLPIIDNLERALANGQSDPSNPLFQGIRMTLQQLGKLLGQHGIEPVADVGQIFDPHRHEAISVQNDPTQPDQIVLDVTQRGYCQGDKAFRPAQVIVNDRRRYPGDRDAR